MHRWKPKSVRKLIEYFFFITYWDARQNKISKNSLMKTRETKKWFFFCQIKFLLSIKDLLTLQWFHCKTAQLSPWLARPFNPYRVKILRESIETIVTQLKLVFLKAENKICILLWSLRSVFSSSFYLYIHFGYIGSF